MGLSRRQPIGVLDSGLGGLTLARELARLLPRESIVYFGDNANCPYGNRAQDEILELTRGMLDFLREKGVKLAAIACNTISTLIDSFRDSYDFPVVSIVEAVCGYVAALSPAEAAVFATEFTISRGVYEERLRQLCPGTKVLGVSSRSLAAMVDTGRFYEPEIGVEIGSMLREMRNMSPTVSHVILGCTHFPIVEERFRLTAPDITYINPALEQAKAVKALLLARGLLADGAPGRMEIYTSGERTPYEAALEKLGMNLPVSLNIVGTRS